MSRRGYTFVELLLVLAILAAVAAVAWPAVVRFTGEQAVKDAAERVRAELDRTRFRAINAGVTFQFRYEPNGRRFIAVPAELDLAPQQQGSTVPPTGPQGFSGEIRDGLLFVTSPGTPSGSERVSADWLAGLPDAAQLGETAWSPPILYRPDGTGTTSVFRIADERQRYVELSVRGLTGMATASPLRKETTR